MPGFAPPEVLLSKDEMDKLAAEVSQLRVDDSQTNDDL